MVTLFYMALDCILYELFTGHFVLQGPGLYPLWVVHWSLCSTWPWTVFSMSCSLVTLFYMTLDCILYKLFNGHFVLYGPGLYPLWVVHWSLCSTWPWTVFSMSCSLVTLFYMALDCILYELFTGHFVLHGPGLYPLWVVHWSLCSTWPWTVFSMSCSLVTLFYMALDCILYELFTGHFVLHDPRLYSL